MLIINRFGYSNFSLTFLVRLTVAVFIIHIIFTGCANQLPPTGGEVDRIPPEVIYVYPADGTTNFQDDYFEIGFSEYVDKRSFREAVFISPFIDGKLEFEWNGTTAEVSFPGKLKDDITYTVTIGTDVVDRNNSNRMASSFSFSFSTGDKIDKKIISGKVFGKEAEGIFLYAYKFNNENEADSLLKRKPDYISQSGSGGKYALYGLGSGKYRVFAVNDKFKDLIYQQEQDEIGIPFKDVVLSDTDSIFTNLNFILFNADTSKPGFISCIMTDKFHLLAAFNKEISSYNLSSHQFSIVDSTALKDYDVKYLYKGKAEPEELIFVIKDELNPDNQVYLFADSLKDAFGNLRIQDYTKIIVSDRQDTSVVMVSHSEPVQNGIIDFLNPNIKIYFNDAFDKKEIYSAINFTDTLKNTVPFTLSYPDDAVLQITPSSGLRPDKDYVIKFNLKYFVDAAGNKTDSVYTLKFKTISGLDFTGLSGRIAYPDTSGFDFNLKPVLVLENSEVKGLIKKQRLTSEEFGFTRVEPGKYLLWLFLDEDGNGDFNFGYPAPFEYSEKFFFYPDTLNLRTRWEITDLKFNLK